MKAKELSTQIFLFLFFILPSIINSLATTGAFEITLDGVLVFSRLQSGRFPTADELINVMNNAGLHEMK